MKKSPSLVVVAHPKLKADGKNLLPGFPVTGIFRLGREVKASCPAGFPRPGGPSKVKSQRLKAQSQLM